MATVPLEGRRVRLRPPTDDDVPTLFAWVNDAERVAPFDRFAADTLEEFREGLRSAPSDPRSLAPRFVIERKEGEPRLVGYVGFYDAHPVLSLTDVWYVLADPGERGKGYGTEVFFVMVYNVFYTIPRPRIEATCDVENLASQRLLERLGFKREGTLTAALYHHGQWHDVAVYGVTRSRWAARPRPA